MIISYDKMILYRYYLYWKKTVKSLILASGFGVRLHPLTVHKPKGLLEYKGKPLVTHIIDKIPSSIEIYINTNKKYESHFRKLQRAVRHIKGYYADYTYIITLVRPHNTKTGGSILKTYHTGSKNIHSLMEQCRATQRYDSSDRGEEERLAPKPSLVQIDR